MNSRVKPSASQEMHDDNPLQGGNIWQSLFETFDEDAFFENLHNKVKDTSYYHKHKIFVAVLHSLSYLFNGASALAASYLVYYYINWLTGSLIAGYIIGGLFLITLEIIKRISSTEFWQVYWFKKRRIAWGWLLLSFGCLTISLLSSASGVKKGTNMYSPPLALIKADSLSTLYKVRIDSLESENKLHIANKNRQGETYWPSQMAIADNKEIIKKLNSEIIRLDQKTEGKNELLTTDYQASVEFTGWTMAAVTALMELLFECCIGFIWYYKFRSYVERTTMEGTPTYQAVMSSFLSSSPTPAITPSDFQQILALLQEVRQEKPEPINGNTPSNLAARSPIGFQRDLTDDSVQTCTNVYRGDDRYTVPHTYTKAGATHTVRYTLPQITARINQYQRELSQARVQKLGKVVVQNRQRWLEYWSSKQVELIKKIQAFQEIE